MVVRGFALVLLCAALALAAPPTAVHEKGYCAMYGVCGSETGSKFSPKLNCPANVKAQHTNDTSFQELISKTCGPRFKDIPLCCDSEQLTTLSNNLASAVNLVGSCPACWENFKGFFCDLACSPDQSTFLNVTETMVAPLEKVDIVTRVDFFVSDVFGGGFFNSCRDVKFGSDNSFAMNLIGGGAKNYLGEKPFHKKP
ncbi:hypothetical protein HDU67_000953 [Dinochytrium kinnereticum]|nr:hypothetical protein HDU67_000953 [Dinochytrium kinnereticum]